MKTDEYWNSYVNFMPKFIPPFRCDICGAEEELSLWTSAYFGPYPLAYCKKHSDAEIADYREQKLNQNVITCSDCNGTGRYIGLIKTDDCLTCHGFGKINKLVK